MSLTDYNDHTLSLDFRLRVAMLEISVLKDALVKHGISVRVEPVNGDSIPMTKELLEAVENLYEALEGHDDRAPELAAFRKAKDKADPRRKTFGEWLDALECEK